MATAKRGLRSAQATLLSGFPPSRSVCRSCQRLTRLTRVQHRPISSYGYEQSKALVYSSWGEPKNVLSLHKYSISPASGTNVVLRMLLAPINPADVNQIQGVYPSKPEKTTALGTAEPAAVGGNEGVAEVIGVGSGVKPLSRGDWVIMKNTGMGTWRTHMAVDESQLFKIDDKQGLTPLEVGTVSVNPTTAYRMLLDHAKWNFRGDEWFIQNGANSGVGQAAVQLGREWGLKSINIIRSRPDKNEESRLRKHLMDIGATHVVTDEEVTRREFRDQVKEWTNGGREQVKLGLNCVGGNVAVTMAKLLSSNSTFVTYGAMSRKPLEIPASLLIFKDVKFVGFWVSKWSDEHPEQKKQTVNDILRLTREGKFRDLAVEKLGWGNKTEDKDLIGAVQGTLEGFRAGKGVFVFDDD